MVKAITPFSTRAKEGATDAPLGDFVVVDQEITPTALAGFFDKNTGKLEGVLGSDKLFTIDDTHEAVPNGQAVLSPQVTPQYIDMTGFQDVFIGIKVTNGGAVKLDAVMGPNDLSFANLNPIDPAKRIEIGGRFDVPASLQTAFYDSAQTLTVDVWNIFQLQGMLANQKLLQFKITNDTGAESDIQFAYMRLI